ncbi:methyltransferase domain-containing protein [Cognatishimia maritima]|uniref:Malonyl-CoA O-methyltransferase n=1 Tax=Cognatishimia maritima TaxID=870908 RepID=A0A1M5MZ60_9RHOB|nr:methyltransferase domain-containing protein [Cognatishimia maritima]SHG82505.1 malonyl-CoA O-methyltransferase [Cognatishimia maritima]
MKDLTFSPTQSKVQQSFRRGLASYHETASQQADIAERLCTLLRPIAPPTLLKVFEFGMGTGHLTLPLTRSFNIAALTVNDLVPECAAYAPESSHFVPGPIEAVELPSSLDLICSASTVQWIDDLPGTIARLTDALTEGGLLALSGFGTAQFHELRALGSTAAAPSYVDAEGWRAILPSNMTVKHLSQARKVNWFPTALALLKHLRGTGVNGAASQSWSASDLKRFEKDYWQRFGTPRGLPLTYDPVWIIAQKSQ